MKCPHDGTEMDHVSRHGVEIDHCPQCGGVWLDRGELDHLIEAVRPAVALEDPEPAPPPAPETDTHGQGHRYQAESPGTKKRAVRFEDREELRRAKPGKGRRYGSKYSKKDQLRYILEEIFDFD